MIRPVAIIMLYADIPGKCRSRFIITASAALIRLKAMERKKRSSNFPINSFLKSTGTVKIDFRVSSVVSLEITKEETVTGGNISPRLPEAVILPLCPDKGTCLHYDPNLSASVYLENDLEQLLRQNQ